jgi:hypothetical protein
MIQTAIDKKKKGKKKTKAILLDEFVETPCSGRAGKRVITK